jgi:hypothetical protein
MFLVLCSSNDYAARWAFEGLGHLGVAPLELITSEDLAYSRFWEHRVGTASTSVRLSLPDGRTICSSGVTGALNRLLSAPQELVNHARPNDRDYAAQELSSFYLSWLRALPGTVINRPTPQGFCGRWRHTSEWALLAQRAGLPAPPFRQTIHNEPEHGFRSLAPQGASVESAIVLDGKVFGPALPEGIVQACCRFAILAESELLGIDVFRANDGRWNFAAATPYPELSCGGQPLLAQLAQVFAQGAKQ